MNTRHHIMLVYILVNLWVNRQYTCTYGANVYKNIKCLMGLFNKIEYLYHVNSNEQNSVH